MARMRPPVITEKPVPVLTDDTLKKLLRACAGKEFTELRDTAILRMLIDTGMRREEIAGIRLDDLDLDPTRQRVDHPQGPPHGHPQLLRQDRPGLERYLRARMRHPLAAPPGAVARREAPRPADGRRHPPDARPALRPGRHPARIHPHQFRHTAADFAMNHGMSDHDFMRSFGWKSRQMLARYAAATPTSGPARRTAASAPETGYRDLELLQGGLDDGGHALLAALEAEPIRLAQPLFEGVQHEPGRLGGGP